VSVNVYIVPEGQITPSSTVIFGRIMSERNTNIYLMFSGELHNNHYNNFSCQLKRRD
jgi:hypothetical protein